MSRRLVLVAVGLLGPVLLLASAGLAKEAAPASTFEDLDVSIRRIDGFCNSYLLTCKKTKRFVVVDPCPESIEAILAHRRAGHALEAVWITHEHGDHLAGLSPLKRQVEVPAYGHPKTKAHVEAIAKRATWDWKDQNDRPLPAPPRLDKTYEEGDTAKVGALGWQVLHVPGHSPGSIAFVLKDRYVVAGDVLFQGSVGRTDLDSSDHDVFCKSLSEKLWDLPDKMVVLPGHMDTTTIGQEKKSNWLFQDFVRKARGQPPIERPWLGVMLDQTYTGKGIRLSGVTSGSPAAKAGLRKGDVIVTLDGKKTDDLQTFATLYRRHGVGDAMKVEYMRGDEKHTTMLSLGKRPPQ